MTLWGSPKDFTVPTGPPGKAALPEQQTSHTTPPRHRAKRDAGEPPQGFQARQENRSPKLQSAQYLLEIPVWPVIPARVSTMPRPTPRHGGNSEATQRTRPDHRPGGQRQSNHPWVSVRSQWTPSRHDLKSAPLAGWEISPLWTTTVPRYDLNAAHLAVWGVNLLKLPHRSSYWVLLVRGALFCIIQHNPSESPREGLPPSATRRTRLNAVVPQREEGHRSWS